MKEMNFFSRIIVAVLLLLLPVYALAETYMPLNDIPCDSPLTGTQSPEFRE